MPLPHNYRRKPTKFEQGLAIFFSGALMLIFGYLSGLLWLTDKPGFLIAAIICTVLFLTGAILFFRAAFSSSRVLDSKELNALAWTLIVLGLCGSALALLMREGLSGGRLGLLGTSLTSLANGLTLKIRR